MESKFEKNKIKLWEIMRVNNSFLIFSTKIYLKDAAIIYPHNLTIYNAEAYLIRGDLLLVAQGVLLATEGCIISQKEFVYR